jgi:hypothetical protein
MTPETLGVIFIWAVNDENIICSLFFFCRIFSLFETFTGLIRLIRIGILVIV